MRRIAQQLSTAHLGPFAIWGSDPRRVHAGVECAVNILMRVITNVQRMFWRCCCGATGGKKNAAIWLRCAKTTCVDARMEIVFQPDSMSAPPLASMRQGFATMPARQGTG
jgi:hypothetical protein